MHEERRATASPHYAVGRLEDALHTATTAADEATRARAAAKADRWRAVLDGMKSGTLTIGSRTPVAGTPPWVTLEVVTGGFATGRYLAEQPLDHDERARHAELPAVPGSTPREQLNLWYLSDAGQAELLTTVGTERYRIDLPEHAALAVVALLVERGHAEAALDLVAELRPFLYRCGSRRGPPIGRCLPSQRCTWRRSARSPQPCGQQRPRRSWSRCGRHSSCGIPSTTSSWPCGRRPWTATCPTSSTTAGLFAWPAAGLPATSRRVGRLAAPPG